jgi:hypothetical protein
MVLLDQSTIGAVAAVIFHKDFTPNNSMLSIDAIVPQNKVKRGLLANGREPSDEV